MVIRGRCHCGNLSFELRTDRSVAELGPRECQCSFCRAQAAKCVSDPQGSACVRIADESRLIRYRFGLQIADFLVCGCCGVYLGAVCEDEEGLLATLNLRMTEHYAAPGHAVSYEGEDGETRRGRRRERWTPARIEIGAIETPGASG